MSCIRWSPKFRALISKPACSPGTQIKQPDEKNKGHKSSYKLPLRVLIHGELSYCFIIVLPFRNFDDELCVFLYKTRLFVFVHECAFSDLLNDVVETLIPEFHVLMSQDLRKF